MDQAARLPHPDIRGPNAEPGRQVRRSAGGGRELGAEDTIRAVKGPGAVRMPGVLFFSILFNFISIFQSQFSS